ncbi:DUF3857 domain-containing protein [Aurantiacibacter suaedae]|uniref:DUF3857 domain-containing protein n=1 Tax=Aurantiacibacter suaedae TaxID=2545755 RepID=UPI001F4F57C1|nr:DUF3857 domain-containing protein [Aurantiacibacter suaedae]
MTSSFPALRLTILSLALSTASAALAQNDGVTLAPAPEWVDEIAALAAPEDAHGAVFFRRQQTQTHFGSEGQFTYSAFQAMLLQPNALSLGNIAITWNPAAGTPTVHKLNILRDGETIDVLADHEFEVLRRENQLEQAWIDGLLTATLQVPDLRIGDELEIAYTVPSGSPTLTDRDYGLLFLADVPPPGRFRIALDWADGAQPEIVLAEGLEPFATRTANSLVIDADNPPAFSPPRDAPPRYAWQRTLQFSDFPSWPAVSQRIYGLFDSARQLGPDSPVRREAERIAARHADPMVRAAAALELVEQQVRYIYVGLNDGALTPASAEETWQRRYGDCKGKTALLLALLDELGVPAQAVLASNAGIDDGLDQRLPSPMLFDHVLVRAEIEGQTYWLDGTFPAVARPSERPLLPYRWVLPLTETGSNLDPVEWQPDSIPRTIALHDIDAREGFETPARLRQTRIMRGPQALVEYAQFSAATDDQLEMAFRNQLAGSTYWDTIDDVTWRFDIDHQASILEIVGTGLPDWDERSGDRFSLTLPGGGFSPPERRQRSSDQDQDAPFIKDVDFTCNVTTVRLPADTKPEQWSYNTAFSTRMYGTSFRRAFERRGKEIRMIRVSRTEQPEVDRDLAERDNARLADFDNSMARIEFDPYDDFSASEQQRVPATDEVDWLDDYSACMADLG